MLSKLKHQIKSKASRNDFQHINRRQVLRSTMNFVQKARPPPFNSLLNIETTNREASIEIERYIYKKKKTSKNKHNGSVLFLQCSEEWRWGRQQGGGAGMKYPGLLTRKKLGVNNFLLLLFILLLALCIIHFLNLVV